VNQTLRVAVIGAGRMGAFHVETWEQTPRARLLALADPDEDVARARIGRRPIEWDADWRSTLERADVDAVTVATPTELHAEITLAALEAGKHVLVEKPISSNTDEALRMADAARDAGRKLMVGHVERFNPAVGKVAELLGEGRVGRVFRAEAVRVGPLPARRPDSGVAIDLATHDLDIMEHVLGQEITRVYAEGASLFTDTTEEDLLTGLLEFGAGGPFGLLDVNWLTPEKRRELTILGEGGMLRASYLTQDVWFVESATTLTGWDELALVRGDAEGSVIRFALHKVEPLRAEIDAFAACVVEDLPEPVSAYDGARALAAALAMRRSAREHRSVELAATPAASPG